MEKSEERKKEDCELLDAFHKTLLNSVGKWDDIKHQFKSDNDLLPKNVSGWYLTSQRGFGNWISFLDYEKNIFYGINADLEWFKSETMEDFGLYGLIHPATKQQVEERLFTFFEKMGFVDGAEIKSILYKDCTHVIGGCTKGLMTKSNEFWIGGNCIMKDGILAEFIEESEVDKLKAEIRKLSDKLKELGE